MLLKVASTPSNGHFSLGICLRWSHSSFRWSIIPFVQFSLSKHLGMAFGFRLLHFMHSFSFYVGLDFVCLPIHAKV